MDPKLLEIYERVVRIDTNVTNLVGNVQEMRKAAETRDLRLQNLEHQNAKQNGFLAGLALLVTALKFPAILAFIKSL